ncbi:MAG: hypothetical protein GX227_09595 [Clostridiaceae bacterium]|jgi:hypothetical protein|nr:hypothetical protein [Clostridiaceae bacterium]
MDRNNYINRFRAFVNIANKKFSALNKGSKALLGIGKVVFFIFLLAALFLSIMFITDPSFLNGQVRLIEWIVLYSFRFWVILFFGALILDILINRY